MLSKVTYLENLRTEAVHYNSDQKILTDAPVDNNGKGEAFSPTDLVCTALASCMLTIIGIVANKHDINIKDTTAEVDKIMTTNPRRINEIVVKITFNNPINNLEKKQIEDAAKGCPVSESLNDNLKQNINFIYN